MLQIALRNRMLIKLNDHVLAPLSSIVKIEKGPGGDGHARLSNGEPVHISAETMNYLVMMSDAQWKTATFGATVKIQQDT